MKKSIYLIVFLIALNLVFAQQAQDQPLWSADVLPICDGVCLEGNEAVWLVQINNIGQTSIRFSQLTLVDNQDITFGFIDLTQEEAVVPPGQSGTVYVPGIIPPPSRSSTLFYKLNYVIGNDIFPDNMFRRMIVMPQSDVECTANDFCDRNEICAGYRCVPYSLFNQSEVPKPSTSITPDAIQIILLSVAVILLMLLVLFNIKRRKSK